MLHLPTVKDNLSKYIDAGFPILYIYTYEEAKADRYIASVAGRREVLEWNGSDGFVNFQTKAPLVLNQSLEATLAFLKAGKELNRKLLVLKDAAEALDPDGQRKSDQVIALLKEIARKIRSGVIDATVIIVSSTLHIPQELEKLITVLELDLPDEAEISGMIDQFAQDNEISSGPADFRAELATAFKGLTESEIRDLLSLAVSQDGELTKKALQLIFDQKQQMILKAGILEMIPLKESVSDIGGLEVLKDWLQKKATVFKNIKAAAEFGVSMPKGVLIAGCPGCGKSLSAKAAGKLFDVPLLRLDMGRLMGKYVGESEENMRKAIRLAEAISPCVLWVDELEKAFAGISSGGGGNEVTTRLFGTFLTWMQEKKSAAFVVATANDITQLPPELLRKGRFDEIFYVALPEEEERRKIFEIHLNKRRKADAAKINLDKLVDETKGYSGADIEGVVSESVESAFVKGHDSLDISSDDPEAMEKLQAKLEGLQEDQAMMKAVNAYYRKHKTLDGCPELTLEARQGIEKSWSMGWYVGIPFPTYALSNNNAEINRTKKRIEALRVVDEMEHVEIEFDGGMIVTNEEINRVQIFFDTKPDEAVRRELKSWGFRWSPREGAWQAQRTPRYLQRAKRICHVE